MRVINFRAWNKEEKKMIEDYIVYNNSTRDFYFDYGLMDGMKKKKDFDFDKFSLMQYTGTKDKNGVEIYEGDILSFVGGEGYEPSKENYIVEWNNDPPGFDPFVKERCGDDCYMGWCEPELFLVVGNIYENKELI